MACPNCTRTFFEDRLKIHLRSCTSNRPAKRLLKAGHSVMD